MRRRQPQAASGPSSALWPSAEYDRQLTQLRKALGESVYLVEARFDAQHVSARMSGTSHELLDIVEFPRPDPARHLYPHVLLLDDGRGINLGRILRVSRDRPYAPSPEACLFENRALSERILPSRRRLSPAFIHRIAKRQLGKFVASRNALPADSEQTDD